MDITICILIFVPILVAIVCLLREYIRAIIELIKEDGCWGVVYITLAIMFVCGIILLITNTWK